MEYVIENWDRVSPLLACPASTKEARACFSCTDVQVAECALTNPQVVEKERADMSDTPFEFKTREEWLELANDNEGSKAGKKVVVDALKAMKVSATEYLGKQWAPEKRVDVIMEFQEKNGYGGEDKKPAKGKKTAAAATAAPAAAAATATKAPAATTAPAASSATAVILQQLEALGARMTAMEAMVKDTHYIARTIAASNELLELAEGEEWKDTHYGVLVIAGEAEGND